MKTTSAILAGQQEQLEIQARVLNKKLARIETQQKRVSNSISLLETAQGSLKSRVWSFVSDYEMGRVSLNALIYALSLCKEQEQEQEQE